MSLISISHAPNLKKEHARAARSFLLFPWKWGRWQEGDSVGHVEQHLKNMHNADFVKTLDSGRSGMLLALRALELKDGDEVIIQALTCVVLPNAIKWAGGTCVFADVDESFNIDPASFRERITPKTRAVVIQHTFGNPANMDELVAIARQHEIVIIEDCAHALGAQYKGLPVGSFGAMSFFSFGRDKVVSSVVGGAVLAHGVYADRVARLCSDLPQMPRKRVFQSLAHSAVFGFILSTYQQGIGKLLIRLFQILSIFNRAYEPCEKRMEQPSFMPSLYPNALAAVVMLQLDELDSMNEARRRHAAYYKNKLSTFIDQSVFADSLPIYLRYSLLVRDRDTYFERAKNVNIILGDWYTDIVMPSIPYRLLRYQKGSCPRAEDYAKRLINLPTYQRLTESDLHKVTSLFV